MKYRQYYRMSTVYIALGLLLSFKRNMNGNVILQIDNKNNMISFYRQDVNSKMAGNNACRLFI